MGSDGGTRGCGSEQQICASKTACLVFLYIGFRSSHHVVPIHIAAASFTKPHGRKTRSSVDRLESSRLFCHGMKDFKDLPTDHLGGTSDRDAYNAISTLHDFKRFVLKISSWPSGILLICIM